VFDVVTILTSTFALVSATILIFFRNRSESAPPDRLIWWLPLAAVIAAGVVLLSLMVNGANDSFLFVMLIAPSVIFIGLLCLLVGAIWKRPRLCLSVSLALVGFVAILWSLERNEETVRPFIRWHLWSHQYKVELMTQPDPTNGDLQHMEWDAWGFVPSGFNVTYLVFDPSDSLAIPAKARTQGRLAGIPCAVQRVFRLENKWYGVRFYTDEDWHNCPAGESQVRRN
jgi:hypothetical protein